MKIKISDIRQLIRGRFRGTNFDAEAWMVLSEIRTTTGFKSDWKSGEPFTEKYVDMMVFSCWPSRGYLRIVFEIKTSRADFLDELKKPEKRWLAMMYSHQFYFVAPEGIIKGKDLPKGCGWMEVKEKDGKLKLHIVWEAPVREASPMPPGLIASVIRRAYKEGIEKGRLFEQVKKGEA